MLRLVFVISLVMGATMLGISHASTNEDMLKSELATVEVSSPLINEVVKIKPIANHHFNLQAPQNCGDRGTIDPTAREIRCQFHKSGTQKAMVSVCDNDKKYCKQQNFKFAVQAKNSGTPRIEAAMLEDTKELQKQMKSQLMPGFEALTPEQAKAKAGGKKGILVLVSAEWCPPCNLLKEFLMPTEQYKQATKGFLKVYVDGDSPIMNPWRDVVGSPGYPSHFLLDSNLNIVDIKVDSVKAYEFTAWAKRAETLLGDPISSLQSRIDSRINGSLLQKVKDVFQSKQDIENDNQRFLSYLENRLQLKDSVKYHLALYPESSSTEVLRARYLNASMRDGSLIDDEKLTKKQFLKQSAQTLLAADDGKGHWVYESLLRSQCQQSEKKEKKSQSESSSLTPKFCEKLVSDYVLFKKSQLEKKQDQLLPQEKLYELASMLFTQGRMSDLMNTKKKSQVLYANCFKAYDKMAEFSPLKEKSRATRIYSLYCRNRMEETPSLETLLSLVEDYPHDSTFYLPLARHYLKEKQVKNAGAAIDTALKYAYGDNWIHAQIIKSRVLAASNKKSEAQKILQDSLSEITSAPDDRRTLRWLSRVRFELKKLNK